MFALEGIRVVDLSQSVLGPSATTMLGDMGADVIKVEPRTGDMIRGTVATTSRIGVPQAKSGSSSHVVMLAHHRNKRSLALDLGKPEGREIVLKLVSDADVFVHSLQPKTAMKLGLDYKSVSQLNPRIVYASGSGYGPQGPESDSPSLDLAVQAYSGIMQVNGRTDDLPQPIPFTVVDIAAGMWLAYGMVVALLHRERTGKGQEVSSSLLGAALALQSADINFFLQKGQTFPRNPRGTPLVGGLYQIFKTQNGWLALAGVGDARWPAFCKALGFQHLQNDPRFATSNARIANFRDLMTILDQAFLAKPRDEWVKLLKDAGQVVAPVNSYAEVVASPQVAANDYICQFDDPSMGPTKLVGIPIKLSETPGKIRRLYPDVGEQTNEILLEAGYSWEDIATLTTKEVVGFAA